MRRSVEIYFGTMNDLQNTLLIAHTANRRPVIIAQRKGNDDEEKRKSKRD